MANNSKKYVSLTRLSDFLDNIKAKFSEIGHKHTISDMTDYKVDASLSPTSTNPVQNKAIDAEFDAVAVAMDVLETAIDGKADASHSHDDRYYTETEVDTKLNEKSDKTHNHDSAYDAKGSAADSLASAKSYTDTKIANLASTSTVDTKISTHNTSTSAHSDIRDLITGLTTRLNTLANSDDTTLDQMSEVVAYIKNNKSLIDGITTSKVNVSDIVNNLTTNTTNKPLSAAQGVAIKALIDALQEELDSHTHAIADVSGLQTALDGKAASSHGTHVSYSTTAPVMDGTASAGSASTVARSDHKHPTDTSRAAKTDLDTHTGNTTVHITAAERTKWNDAYTIAESKPDDLSDLGITATATELNYVDGVTSSVQTQLDGKAGKKVEGQTITIGDVEYIGGVNAEVFNDYEANVATGAYSHAEGCYNKASGDYSHAEGAATISSGYAGHAEGYQTNASGSASHAEGKNTAAIGQCTHAEGSSSTAVPNTITSSSSISTVETAWNSAKFTLAKGTGSHAEGSNTLALNTADHSEGYETVAKGGYSHAQGYKTKATGGRAHAEGQGSTASGNDSHAEGAYTIAAGECQHVQGKYNVEDTSGKYAHIVGGGSNTSNRKNIHTVDWSGNAWFKGNIYVGGSGQDDVNASKLITEAYQFITVEDIDAICGATV